MSNFWSLSPDDRKRLIRAAIRERYDLAMEMENLKESIKQYNMIREVYEVK